MIQVPGITCNQTSELKFNIESGRFNFTSDWVTQEGSGVSPTRVMAMESAMYEATLIFQNRNNDYRYFYESSISPSEACIYWEKNKASVS